MSSLPHDSNTPQETTEPFNPHQNPYRGMEVVQSKPLDYWHSLLVYYDGAVYYWQIYNHKSNAPIQALADYHLMRVSAKRAGMAFWRAIAADAGAGGGGGA